MIEVEVDHLAKRREDIYVVLKERGGNRHLDIPIGETEAFAIDGGHRRTHFPRPMTHVFIADLVRALGDVALERVVITEIRGEIYFAELHVRHADSLLTVDTRPSDAISLALRLAAPIFVDDTTLAAQFAAA
jgi:hypothetical protein